LKNQACTSPPLAPRVTAQILGVLLRHRNHSSYARSSVSIGKSLSGCIEISNPAIWTHERNTSHFLAQFGGISICGESFQRIRFSRETAIHPSAPFQKLVRIQSIPHTPSACAAEIDGASLPY
jgi:hypothetical protein